MAKARTIEQRSIDPAAQQMLIRADELGIGTVRLLTEPVTQPRWLMGPVGRDRRSSSG